jgi:oligosaccharide repeat unit polymerase
MNESCRSIWWLHPAAPFVAAGIAISVSAYLIPEHIYRMYWRMPKFFDLQGLWVTLACCGVFAFAVLLSSRFIGRFPQCFDRDELASAIPWKLTTQLFSASFYLTLLGYLLWAAFAIQRGMTIQSALDVMTGAKGAMYEARYSYLQTVGGVTTLTQFGCATLILGAIIGFFKGWRLVRFKLGVLLFLALIRAMLNSERFALIELVVPFLIALLAPKYLGSPHLSRRARLLLNLAPVIGLAALFLLFTSFEYLRSWSNYYEGREQGFLEFGSMRLLGYYVTSFNNGAYFLNRLDPLSAPYFTMHFLWTFPLSRPALMRLFPNPLLDTSDRWFYFPFLDSEANLEFNSADGMLFPLMDFGIAGGLIYWFAAGLACGVIYQFYLQGRISGLLLYPLLYLGLMELPLSLYWSEGRAVFPQILLIAAPVLFAFTRRYGLVRLAPAFS